MKINKITIKNFRGVDNLENLEVSDFNVFVGKNDAGKSIILNAFNCFFNDKVFVKEDIFNVGTVSCIMIFLLIFMSVVGIKPCILTYN